MALLAAAPGGTDAGGTQQENRPVLIALFNNLPEIALGLAWSGLIFWAGRRFERRFPKKAAK